MPRPYRYQLAPSTSASSCPVSCFELSCNFSELADKYPEFASAWAELQSGRNQSEEHNDAGTTPATPTALASRVSHKFNAALSRSLLHHHFQLDLPSLPPGRLCPPIPNRANYACWIRELLVVRGRDLCRFNPEYAADTGVGNEDNLDKVGGRERRYRGIDIGTGVSAIYPLLLSTELFAESDGLSTKQKGEGEGRAAPRQWKFLATDIDPLAIRSARANVQANQLEDQIFVTQVENGATSTERKDKSQKGPLHAAMMEAKKLPAFQSQDGASKFDFVMTNPPFYETAKEASEPRAGDKRSRTDMTAEESVYPVNGGDMDDIVGENQSNGGDAGFVAAIMADSQTVRRDVTWYTSLVAKRSSLDALLKKLQTLDGVWGNRGQIRTVEFRQGNIEGEGDERREKKSSTRVRWGIGWTYERAVGRCSACRVRGGLQSFEVWITLNDSAAVDDGQNDNAARAIEEVVSRLVEFFEQMRDVSLKCSQVGANSGLGRRVAAVEERFFGCNSSRPPVMNNAEDNSNLPHEGHFIVDASVNSNGRTNDGGQVSVQIELEMYSHTKRGASVVNTIRGPMPGEIGRTNRRWRRLLKRQSGGTG